MNVFLRFLKRNLVDSVTEAKPLDLTSLPLAGLGCALTSSESFKGSTRPFFDLYLSILGREKVNEILKLHGFEYSALYSLHNEAIKLKAIPKTQLLVLANGNREMLGFVFQPPTLALAWEQPYEHYRAELFLGEAIKEPLKKHSSNNN